jgi:hypothetical protein
MRHAIAGLFFATCASLAVGAAPEKSSTGEGWIDLLKSGKDSPWKKIDARWIPTTDATLDPEKKTRLKAAAKTDDGPVWVNGVDGRVADL